MPSIVLELRRDSINSAVAVSDLLRKALLIATKLDIPDFKTWVENELDGYRNSNSIPPYRVGPGTVMAQDRWGRWIPVFFKSSEETELVATLYFSDPVAEIEGLMQRALSDEMSNLKSIIPQNSNNCSAAGFSRISLGLRGS
jgi:AbiTii-like protein